ncbi:MAG TPA: hypothetical protein VJ827_08950 [Rubrobacter sp.]|nr:hypothetical protein [Rubrobacter sp.]
MIEALVDYDAGQVFDVVVISELREGKMWRDRWYFAEPFEAPGWQAQWAGRMESQGSLKPPGTPHLSSGANRGKGRGFHFPASLSPLSLRTWF